MLSTGSWGRGCVTYIIKVPESSAVKALRHREFLEEDQCLFYLGK